jgi:hypothetical protein
MSTPGIADTNWGRNLASDVASFFAGMMRVIDFFASATKRPFASFHSSQVNQKISAMRKQNSNSH